MQASFHVDDDTIDALFESASSTDLFVGLLLMSSPTTHAFVQRLLEEGPPSSGGGGAWWDAANKHRGELDASLSLKWRALCLRALRGGMAEQEEGQRPHLTPTTSNDTPTPLAKRASSIVRPSTSLQVEREVQRVFSTFMKEGGSGSPSRAGSMRNPRRADLGGSKRRNRSVTFDSNAFDHEDVESGSGASDSGGDMAEINTERKGGGGARNLDVCATQLRALYDARAQQHEEELAAVERDREVDCARLVKQVDRLASMVLSLKEQLEVEATKHKAEIDKLHGLHQSVLNHIAQDDARLLNAREKEEERLRGQLDNAVRREEDATASFGRFVSRHPELIDVSSSNQTPTKPRYGRVVTVDNRRRPQTAGSIRLDVKGKSIGDLATSARPPSSLAAELFSSPQDGAHVN